LFHHPLFENMVEGSNWGILRNFDTKEIMIPHPKWERTGKLGKLHIHLCQDGNDKVFGVHQIILPCFLPNAQNKPTIDHIDRNPENNKLSNLRYATQTEQVHDRGKQGKTYSDYLGVSFNKLANKC